MSRLSIVAVSCVAAGVLLTFPGRAHADELAPEAAPEMAAMTSQPPGADAQEQPDGRPEDDPFRSIALTANPLSFILMRLGLNIEYLPTTHHAITLNPYGQFISVGDEATVKTSYSNFGAELGYRFYTGERGANGFFVGPFVTFINSSSSTSSTAGGSRSEVSSSLFAYGGGLDLGGQHVFKNGLTLGGGLGILYLASGSSSASASSNGTTVTASTSDTVKFEGVLPRFLFTVGYSF